MRAAVGRHGRHFPLVLDEVDHLLVARFGGREKDRHIADLVIDDLTALRLDFADAVNIVLADRYLTDSILTLDRKDFRAVRSLTNGVDAFRVLPDDA